MRLPRRPELLAVGGLILILTAVLLGLVVWLVFLMANPSAFSNPGVATEQVLATPTAVGQKTPLFPQERPPVTWTAVEALPPRPTSAVDIEALLGEMSLEEKVGQMIMTGIPGRSYNEQIAPLIETYHFGSVVYFSGNLRNPEQTLRLSQALQSAAAGDGHGIPLLLAIDHEGGAVFRFPDQGGPSGSAQSGPTQSGPTHFANSMSLGAAGSAEMAYQVAAASAQELGAMGINTSLAPVLDVNDEPLNPVIGVRAFGGVPDLVTQMGLAYLRGLQENGMIAAAKHYPGHGSTIEDSHVTLPVVNKTRQQLDQVELAPFRAAIRAANLGQPGIILVGHIAFPQVDPSGAPASLSPVLVEQVLRQELGYTGVVMTDAMSMGAITSRYTLQQAAILAVQAGDDLLAYPEAEQATAAYQAILAAVKDGSIPPSRVDESARRLLQLKQRFGLFSAPPPPSFETHWPLAREAAQKAIVFSGQGTTPLVGSGRLLLVTPDVLPPGSASGDNLSYLGELLRGRGLEVDEWIYSIEDAGQAAAIQSQVQQALPGYPQALLVLWDAALQQSEKGNLSQRNLLDSVLSSGVPALVVAASSPFDLDWLPANQPALATFGGLDYQVELLAEALLASTLPSGAMPVSLHR